MAIKDWPGGVISKTPVAPTSSGASGVWTLDQVAYWAKQGAWPYGLSDPYYEYVSLLLTGNGTNGAQNNTFLDSSTNNFTITRNGNTTQGTFSPYGNLWSNYFDGTGDYLKTPSSSNVTMGSGDFTIELWAYPVASPSTFTTLISLGSSTTNGREIRISSGQYSYGTLGVLYPNNSNSGDLYPDTGYVLPLYTWTHVALCRSGTNLYLFANGTIVGSYSSVSFNQSVTAYVGIANSPYNDPMFNGYISNVRIIKGTALYTSAFTPSTTPLTAVSGTSLLTCQSNRFVDNSSNNFTLTVNGNTSVQRFSPFNPTAPYSAATLGGSGYFDGTGDYLQVANSQQFNFGSGNFTVEMWLYVPSLPSAYKRVFSINNTSVATAADEGVLFEISNTNKMSTSMCSGSTYYTAADTNNITAATWTHWALVRNGTTLTLYRDGTSVATTNVSTLAMNFSATFNLFVGRWVANAGRDYLGYISNLRVVKDTAIYTSNFTPSTTPLTAVSGTSLLCNFTNAGIPDAAMMNDLETVGNAQVSTSVKKYGTGSLAFDGSGDYLHSPWIPDLEFNAGNFTIEFWVYINGGNSLFCWSVDHHYGMTWNYAGSSGNKVGVWASSNGSSWDIFNADGGGNGISTGTISTGTWTHVAWVRNGSSWALYLNGTSAWTGTSSATIVTRSTDKFRIGGPWPGAGPGDFNGYIDDLRITKGYARYTANFTPPTAAFPTY